MDYTSSGGVLLAFSEGNSPSDSLSQTVSVTNFSKICMQINYKRASPSN